MHNDEMSRQARIEIRTWKQSVVMFINAGVYLGRELKKGRCIMLVVSHDAMWTLKRNDARCKPIDLI